MRSVFRLSLTLVVAALVAVPAAHAAGPTATTAAPTAQSTPGSAFSPLQTQVDQGTQTQPTVTSTKRAGDTGTGRGTLLFLSFVAIALIACVGVFIWYEGRKRGSSVKRRRQRHRMRSGRTPQPVTATTGAPPPPPRKRRAQAAKRKKR